MTVRLRIVLDQLVSQTDPDLAAASASMAAALIATAPSGCDVGGMLPASRGADESPLEGLAQIWRAPVSNRELAQAWRWGVPLGAARGMIHSPTLLAPLVRHDRVHDHDQTVVTLWSVEAWTDPARLARGIVAFQRGMLARAVRHADAVVVPTHAMATQLADIAPLGSRIRVITGAPETGFDVPADAPDRVRRAGVTTPFIIVLGSAPDAEQLVPVFARAASLDVDVVVMGAAKADASSIVDRAHSAGLAEHRVHAIAVDDASDRAALFAGSLAVVAVSTAPVYPWRLLEALVAGAPIIAVATAQNEELLADAAILVDPGDALAIAHALGTVVEDESVAQKAKVLSSDRSRAFSWRDAAHRIWQLHAEL